MSVTTLPVLWDNDALWDNDEPYNLTKEGRSGFSCIPEMKFIPLGFSVDSEDPNFPIENVFDDHPKRVYKAAASVDTVRITLPLVGTDNALFLFNTNAEVVNFTIEDDTSIAWFTGNEWFDGNEWLYTENANIPAEVFLTSQRNALGIRFPALGELRTLYIDLSTSDSTLEIGILRCGELIATENPVYGLVESQVDYSITKELSNGAFYYKKRDIVKTFQGTISDKSEFIEKMLHDVSTIYGKKPMPWFLTNIKHEKWLVFGRLVKPMTAVHSSFNRSELSFSIIEVL